MDINGSDFYFGRQYDLVSKLALEDKPVFYDPTDLTTHAVITGMTGSGKTGMGIILLEEAALQGIPAILIDPKGDLTNHLLHFQACYPPILRLGLTRMPPRAKAKPSSKPPKTPQPPGPRALGLGHRQSPHRKAGEGCRLRHLHPRLGFCHTGQHSFLPKMP